MFPDLKKSFFSGEVNSFSIDEGVQQMWFKENVVKWLKTRNLTEKCQKSPKFLLMISSKPTFTLTIVSGALQNRPRALFFISS